MPKLNGFTFFTPINERLRDSNLKRIAHTINYGVYVNIKAELFLHDVERKQIVSFKTNKNIGNETTINSLLDAYKIIYK